jgi:hypothetical protein
MRKQTAWVVGILGVALVVIVASCQCGAPDTTPLPDTSPTPATTTPATTSPATQATTPTSPAPAMTFYENTEHGFSIEYPEGWAKTTHGAAATFYLQANEPEGSLSVGVSLEYKPEAITLDDAVAEGKGYMEAMPQHEIFSEGYVTMGDGISGYEMIGQGDEDIGRLQKYRYVLLVREKQVFWVGVSGDPDPFDAQGQLVETIVDSFKLLPYTYEPPAPSPGGTYTNAEYGFSITYPAGWADYTTGQYAEILDLRAATGIPEVMIRTWTGAASAEESALTLQQVYSDNFADYEQLSEGEITLDDGTPAYEFVFNATMQGYFLTAKCVTVMRGADVFSIMGFGTPSTFARDELVLDKIIGSFHLE